jgi:hypothetical protein
MRPQGLHRELVRILEKTPRGVHFGQASATLTSQCSVSAVSTETKTAKKTYAAPQLRTPTEEQARLFLIGYAWEGDRNARELLALLFLDPAPK